MKSLTIIALLFALPLITCRELEEDAPAPTLPSWGPDTYQIDAQIQNGAISYFAQVDDQQRLSYTTTPVPERELSFRFYPTLFEHYREIIISSPFPIRPNWFQPFTADCLNPEAPATHIEFVAVTAREKDYLLIARLDSTYWHCLKTTNMPIHFAFQILDTAPLPPTRFELRGFYNQQQELLQLKAQRDAAGTWYTTYDYQVFQEAEHEDFSIHVSKHPQLGNGQSLLRIGSSMQLVPQSVWIGLAGECLDQADWEVHRNRLNDRFLLDVVIPDCYLDCLKNTADGFEFEVEFFQ